MSILATNMAATLRSLTKSPITSALDQARRMAKQHLEAGGNVAPAAGGGDEGVVLPADVDVSAVVAAIAAAFGTSLDRRRLAVDALVRLRDGRLAIRRTAVERLGDGNFSRGRQRLERLISQIRAHARRV